MLSLRDLKEWMHIKGRNESNFGNRKRIYTLSHYLCVGGGEDVSVCTQIT